MKVGELKPVSHPVKGVVKVPGSKSITNRALLLAALSQGQSKLSGALLSADTKAMVAALRQLGVQIDWNVDTAEILVESKAEFLPEAAIHCQDAGTVARFLLPACAAFEGCYHFEASARMMARPLAPLVQALASLSAEFKFEERSEHMPFQLVANGLTGGEVSIDISSSSQFASGLMMAGVLAKTPVVLRAKAIADRPYIVMSMKMMADFGVMVDVMSEDAVKLVPQAYQARDYSIEPDASTASYFFAVAAITGGEVTVRGLRREALQGDVAFLSVLEQMGCLASEDARGITVKGHGVLHGVTVDMRHFSDTFMTVAACAVFATTPTTLTGLAHTRLQESDRVAAMAEGLTKLGIEAETTDDSITIHPGPPHGALVLGHNDHRIAMSLSLIGLKVKGVKVMGAECVSKTCPQYFEMMAQLCSD